MLLSFVMIIFFKTKQKLIIIIMTTVIYAGLEQFNGIISKILTVEYWDLTLRLSVTAVLIMKYINDFLPYK